MDARGALSRRAGRRVGASPHWHSIYCEECRRHRSVIRLYRPPTTTPELNSPSHALLGCGTVGMRADVHPNVTERRRSALLSVSQRQSYGQTIPLFPSWTLGPRCHSVLLGCLMQLQHLKCLPSARVAAPSSSGICWESVSKGAIAGVAAQCAVFARLTSWEFSFFRGFS